MASDRYRRPNRSQRRFGRKRLISSAKVMYPFTAPRPIPTIRARPMWKTSWKTTSVIEKDVSPGSLV